MSDFKSEKRDVSGWNCDDTDDIPKDINELIVWFECKREVYESDGWTYIKVEFDYENSDLTFSLKRLETEEERDEREATDAKRDKDRLLKIEKKEKRELGRLKAKYE